MSQYQWKGKTAVVTGAASGMGRALALALARRGCHLALSDVDAGGLAETASLIDGRVLTQTLDVSDRAAVFEHAEAVLAEFGTVDLVFNNAGVDLTQPLADVSFEDFEWLMNINFWGVVYGTKAFLPAMQAQGSGTIVNISSVFGLVGWPSHGTYCASKFAVRGFTESLRHELMDSAITIISVHPGAVATNIARNTRFYRDDMGRTDKAELVEEFNRMAKTTPDQAAATMLKAVEKGRERVLLGDGARFADRLQRLFPSRYFRIIAGLGRMLGRTRSAEDSGRGQGKTDSNNG